MQRYIARRLIFGIPTLFGITVLIFVVMRLLPGDPLAVFYGIEMVQKYTPEQRASIMHDMGLDRHWIVQYGEWMKDVATGKLGKSFLRGDPIFDLIVSRGAISAEIAFLSVFISWVLGLPFGIISALRPNSVQDSAVSIFTVLFLAIPGFWLGLVVVVALITWFDYKSPIVAVQLWQNPWTNLQIVIGPAVVLGLGQAAYVGRMARSTLFEVLREDYVRTARSKGLRERLVLVRHALPNALLPVVTLSGLILAYVMGGSVVVEKAFGAPGLGKALVSATVDRDMNVVQNIVLFYGVVFVIINLGVDLLYGWLDPRIRYE